jgi:hypothetical protein
MTQHDGLPVPGYKPQGDKAIELVTRNKRLEELVLRALDDLAGEAVDRRWYSIGRTDIEKGFMAVNRSIFQPERIKLDGDPA